MDVCSGYESAEQSINLRPTVNGVSGAGMARKSWLGCLCMGRELGQHFCWHRPWHASTGASSSDVNRFPRPQQQQQGRAVPGATCASPYPGRWATPRQRQSPGNSGDKDGRSPLDKYLLFVPGAGHPSGVITRAFNCMPHCPPDIFPLILQQGEGW